MHHDKISLEPPKMIQDDNVNILVNFYTVLANGIIPQEWLKS